MAAANNFKIRKIQREIVRDKDKNDHSLEENFVSKKNQMIFCESEYKTKYISYDGTFGLDNDLEGRLNTAKHNEEMETENDTKQTVTCCHRGVNIQIENDKNLKVNVHKDGNARNRTVLQNFYNGKNIFITGGTGFLGKLLVEKLLRSCPEIDNIYMLVRQKKGKDVYSRLEEIFDDTVFSRLKQEFPKFRHKVTIVPGDCSAPGLGLALEDRRTLVEKVLEHCSLKVLRITVREEELRRQLLKFRLPKNVHIIFHAAATVKFDEQLRAALTTNVHAPLHLLQLARDMRHLQVMMHVSTAYSNCHLGQIDERVYDCPVELARLDQLIDKLDDAQIDRILPSILGPWPNTYTFTKALAEAEIKKNCSGVPLAIFRPAIVTSTAREPIPCWIDNMYGPTGVVAGAATGVLRTLQCDASVTADIVPADLVVNCLLAAAEKSSRSNRDCLNEPLVYNYVSSVENKITWGDFMHLNCKYGFTHPLSSAIWYMCITLNKSAAMNALYKLFLHLLPALLLDSLYVCFGQTPKLLKVYRKIHKFSSVLSYFSTHEISFRNDNVRRLWDDTSGADKKLYPFSMADVAWPEYFGGYIRGIRTYLFKESDGTLQHARDKWNRLYYLHQLVRTLFMSAAVYVAWKTSTVIIRSLTNYCL